MDTSKVKKSKTKDVYSLEIKLPKTVLGRLITAAYSVQQNAYAPYSHYLIGSAIIDSKGTIFSGCNIENSSYGGTVCAERVAIWKGISENMKLPIKAIVVVSSEKDKWPPCGLCRQVLSEFCSPDTEVFFGNNKHQFKKLTFQELMPEAFSADYIMGTKKRV